MNRVVEILIRRDDLTQQEAEDRLLEVKQMMEDCNYDPMECDDIYLMDILF